MPRKKNPKNNYWNQAVEDAVCGYNSATTQSEREKHYRIIYPALCKVAEVLYHKTKFSYSDDDMRDTMAECVIHLTENLGKFKCGIGTKAFSYFTVSARFFYIQLSNRNYRYFQNTIPISSMTENWDVENNDRDDDRKKESAELFYAFLKYCELHYDTIMPIKYKALAKELLNRLNNFENEEELNRRKILNSVYIQLSNREKDRAYLTKVVNIFSSHLTLFKERWESGNESLELCTKNYLTDDEKDFIKKNFKYTKGNTGAAVIARKLGVDVHIVNDYAKSIN
jgi:hypothetical protein